VIVEALSVVYGAAASWRRRWYAATPSRVSRLSRPVVSVGNLRVGGTGKTPAVAAIAQLLLDLGERPAILSRGYARQQPSGGVTIVSDGSQVLADVAHAGDEPLLLARTLPRVPVLVCSDRHRAGRVAETDLAATIHLLDDGFQHVQLWRDVDLLLTDERDLVDKVLPAGRLREPLGNAAVAHAVIAPAATHEAGQKLATRLGVPDAFTLMRKLGAPMQLGSDEVDVARSAAMFAVAGIAGPDRFFGDLAAAGFNVVGTRTFRDHHVFNASDVTAVVDTARRAGAMAIVTTAKDAVRLERLDLSAMPFLVVPLRASIEPAEEFKAWLAARLAAARGEGERRAAR
jgi:tetraacyldisaccharide 4'-kinase